MHRGEIWWTESASTNRRPFLILTREALIPKLHSVVAAPLTRTIRGIPTELLLEPRDGVPAECAASFDNLTLVPKSRFRERITRLDVVKMGEACQALQIATGC